MEEEETPTLNVRGTILWPGVPGRGRGAGLVRDKHQHLEEFLLPNCGCNVTSCPRLLLPHLPFRSMECVSKM